jgi:hypothetical protein
MSGSEIAPAFSTFPPSMAVIYIPDTNSRRFRRCRDAYMDIGGRATQEAKAEHILEVERHTTIGI